MHNRSPFTHGSRSPHLWPQLRQHSLVAVVTASISDTMTVLEAMGGEQAEAIGTLATMVGARALARAVSDDAFSMEILRAVKKNLKARR
jgi:hypothetical protein